MAGASRNISRSSATAESGKVSGHWRFQLRGERPLQLKPMYMVKLEYNTRHLQVAVNTIVFIALSNTN